MLVPSMIYSLNPLNGGYFRGVSMGLLIGLLRWTLGVWINYGSCRARFYENSTVNLNPTPLDNGSAEVRAADVQHGESPAGLPKP